jgi:phosphatidylglycerophosphate synthase
MLYKKFEKFYLDKYINKYIQDNYIKIFKNIHPNIITITGILINVISIYCFFSNHKILTGILFFLRTFCDNLDGMVARYYNKVSNLGGVLDAFADYFMVSTINFIFFYYIHLNFYINLILSILSGSIVFIYLIINDALFIHSNITINPKMTYIDIFPFLIYNNTYLSIIFVSILINIVKFD